MPKNRGSRGGSFRGRGRGGSRGGGGSSRNNNRGRGRGGGGRGRGRKLYPTSLGYVYKVENDYDPESSEGDLEDDFPVFGQFGAVDDPKYDPDIELLTAKGKFSQAKTTKQRKVLDHRALLNAQGSDSEEEVIRSSSSRSNSKITYTKAVTFTRSSSVLNDDSNNEKEVSPAMAPETTATTAETQEKMIIEKTDESSSLYLDSNPSDIVIDEIVDSEAHSQQDDGVPVLGFYFDSNPGPVAAVSNDDDHHHRYNNNQAAGKTNNNGKGKKRQQRKIIPGDDIYLGTSSSSDDVDDDEEEHGHKADNIIHLDKSKGRRTNNRRKDMDDEDDIAIMRDYMENVGLNDDDDEEEGLEALRAFANGTDPAAQNYPEIYELSDSDENVIEVPPDSDEEDDFDTVGNGAFDHQSDDESVQEISEKDFRYALEQSLDQVPPSLQTGIRNRLERQSKRDKKLEKKQKQLDKRATKNAKREYEGNNVQLRKLDKRIRMFIMDDQLSSYQVAPMSKFCRRQLHLLATAYKLKSHSFGTGAQRTPVLQKTRDTFLPADRRYIERFLDEAQSTIDAQSSILRKHRIDNGPTYNKPNKKGKHHGGKKDKKSKPMAANAGPSVNTVVGADVGPIGETNVGHRMLAAMGWKQGDALGANNEGITAPIEAVIRRKRQGLGS
ncbi:hypothetical protein BDB00DRAFT_875984 [Zychaea mexicana]|uniref:uncharacterized protein n=1 Tax=Zychaea mexicana TaxID=64656 RepID=UPI0022FE333E|nr:uncharacterized protein BDB00DRAFT_875984 [Zychaea mexicana]KAI9489755.1 hypothetical protein BDB00DRAFT_875984 [Zychaea mexicana]